MYVSVKAVRKAISATYLEVCLEILVEIVHVGFFALDSPSASNALSTKKKTMKLSQSDTGHTGLKRTEQVHRVGIPSSIP